MESCSPDKDRRNGDIMKLIWLSVAPWAPTGYGLVTRELVPRIQREGHEVIVACKHFHCGDVEWNGMHVIQGMDVGILNRMIDKGEADYIITLLDNHALPSVPRKWISYTPFDTEKIPASISKTLEYPLMIIALTKHGQKEIEGLGYECFYAPHGIDTSIYYPDEQKRIESRKIVGWEDNFVIGSVGVNYQDDRKNFVNLLLAFKKFHDKHNEARLFLSSNTISTDGSDYLPLAVKNLGLDQVMKWSEPDAYFTGQVSDEMMANRYRRMDLFCMPTRGEGFGLPLLEAQACGVPVVTTGASTGPELCPTQYLIPVKEHEWEWFNKEWRPNVNSESIYETLEKAYNDQERALVAKAGEKDVVANYDWDYVFDTYWKPILKEIEKLKIRVQTVPNYKKLYETFGGRITMSDCAQWCKMECPYDGALLPSEKECERPVLARSYPVRPDENGNLMVDTKCPLHGWLSQQFKKEVKDIWEYLWGFPIVRKQVGNHPDGYISMDSLNQDFDGNYRWAMQSQYRTVCPDLTEYLKGSVLEVGCGDGERVKELQEKGVNAIGFDINPSYGMMVADAQNIPFRDNSFDAVYSVDVLEHLPDPMKAIAEAFRVSQNLVISAITPTDDKSFYQDPTHKVEWGKERWLREHDVFGQVVDVLEPFTIVCKKRI